MLAHDAIGHEEPKTGPVFFGCEMRLEKVMAVFISNAVAIVSDSQERRSISASPCFHLDAPILWRGVDGIVDKIRDDLAQEKRVGLDLDLFGRFTQRELDVFRPCSGPRHILRTRH